MKNMLIYAKISLIDSLIVNKHLRMHILGGVSWVLHSKELKGHDFTFKDEQKSDYKLCSWRSRDRVAVVSSLDCCLLAASLSRACSFSSTTNGFFLDDFVNFVPGENWCECLRTGLALSGVTASAFSHLSLPHITGTNFDIYITIDRCRN